MGPDADSVVRNQRASRSGGAEWTWSTQVSSQSQSNRPRDRPPMSRIGRRIESGVVRVRFRPGGFGLSIGDVSVILNRRSAQDVVATLTYALLATVPIEPRHGRTPRKRRRRRPISPPLTPRHARL